METTESLTITIYCDEHEPGLAYSYTTEDDISSGGIGPAYAEEGYEWNVARAMTLDALHALWAELAGDDRYEVTMYADRRCMDVVCDKAAFEALRDR